MTYWKNVFKRAWREALIDVKMSNKVQIIFTALVPIISAAVSYYQTGQPAISSIVALAACALMFILLLAYNMLALPSVMARESEEERTKLASQLRSEEDIQIAAARAEKAKRAHVAIGQIVRRYNLSQTWMSLEMASGEELPPADWMNEELKKAGHAFRVQAAGNEYRIIFLDQATS